MSSRAVCRKAGIPKAAQPLILRTGKDKIGIASTFIGLSTGGFTEGSEPFMLSFVADLEPDADARCDIWF